MYSCFNKCIHKSCGFCLRTFEGPWCYHWLNVVNVYIEHDLTRTAIPNFTTTRICYNTHSRIDEETNVTHERFG